MSRKVEFDFNSFYSQCDELIRSGGSEKARTILRKVSFTEIPRGRYADFANLARRVQLWPLSLRLLRPIIRPKVKSAPSTAKPLEKVEYALALRRAGAFTEAESLLNDSKLDLEPRAIMARGFGFMHHWDYASALVTLDRFLAMPGVSEYDAKTAKVNQLACFNVLEDRRFETLFEELRPQLEKGKNFLLLANILETQAQYFIRLEKWADADKSLSRASQLIANEKGLSSLYVEKWTRILKALKSKDLAALDQFRSEALKLNDWETLRDLDYQQTRINPECAWATTVYYGTPFASFRTKLEKFRPFPAEDWITRSGKTTQEFDPWFPGDMEGELPHALLLILLRDLYRPATAGEIFAKTYSEQYFDLDSSTVRVRQLITRLRKWMTKNEIPLSLNIGEGGYGVRFKAGARVRMRKAVLGSERMEILFGRFRGVETGGLAGHEWAERLGVSTVKVSRLLREAVDDGILLREGQSRYTVYRLNKI